MAITTKRRKYKADIRDRVHEYNPVCDCARCSYANGVAERIARHTREELDFVEDPVFPATIRWGDNLSPISRAELDDFTNDAFGEDDTRWTITEGGEV